MAKIAKLVTFSFITRVIIDDNISESDQMDQAIEQAKPRIIEKINNDEMYDNFEKMENDTEIPYSKGSDYFSSLEDRDKRERFGLE